ncbi:hypothetical protein K1719_043143 [Acacia pycnantha]|nr:hypothetical protein K1719_043143 [Acacia pycnantha]
MRWWVEFWRDATIDYQRRNLSLSTLSSSDRFYDIPWLKMPKWVEEYIGQMGLVLKMPRLRDSSNEIWCC